MGTSSTSFWVILSTCTIAYLLSLPAGWKSYRDHERRAAAAASAAAPAAAPSAPSAPYAASASERDDDRPITLN